MYLIVAMRIIATVAMLSIASEALSAPPAPIYIRVEAGATVEHATAYHRIRTRNAKCKDPTSARVEVTNHPKRLRFTAFKRGETPCETGQKDRRFVVSVE